jgi:hypothetical protein
MSLLCLSSVSLAALPPTAESLRRLKTIAESEEVYDKLGSLEQIKSITLSGDEYIIQTDKCAVTVRVVAVPRSAMEPHIIGPLPLKVKVEDTTCSAKP